MAAAVAMAWGAPWPPTDARAETRERPRLVLMLAVDQLRPDRLDPALPGGLGRLAREGRVYTRAALEHAATETCPGHATMLTGRHPAGAGVPGNEFVDLAAGLSLYCVEDASVDAAVLGGAPGASGRSPRNLRATTLGDWLKADDARSRVFAVSAKDRSAIALGGHDADGVYWLQRSSAPGFTTSRYYAASLPQWVARFNGADPATEGFWADLPDVWDHTRTWPGVRVDDFVGESPRLSRTSPHPLRDEDPKEFADHVYYSPFADLATLDFARELTERESLGSGPATDLLAVSLSATDTVGHLYGPYSQESRDALGRLDDRLADFLAFLEERVGPGGLIVALTADHGVLPLPEWLEETGEATCPVPGGRIPLRPLGQRLWWRLWREFSPFFSLPRMWLVFSGPKVAVDRGMAAEYGVAVEDVMHRAIEIIEAEPGVARVWTAEQIESEDGPLAQLYRNSFDSRRSGDFIVQVEPGCIISPYDAGTTHGSPYLYDRAVPLLFWGPGFPAARLDTPAAPADIAPTLADHLALPHPPHLDGKPLR